ncbi:probable amino-acid acetyltransferase NAGS1, chloroplastic isoform X1 [Zingiber officinale]|uniref:probable amino-acid acetyltransferase NAGS1, chloroplastic isoform X1 n=1 Tax=Zingiber officinale TaxID=94328 RepID=UPI001C4DC8BF|nr:probable amino-acid acetyltransferase NAGS1, chloroplastic isoform X1 [Zingiber officinale]
MAASGSRPWIAGGGGANPNGNLPRIPVASLRYLPLQRGFAERWIISLRCISDGQSVNGSAGEVSSCSYGRAEENESFVRCFRQAWPYIKGHRGSTFVVVLSGEIVDSPYLDSVLQDISLLHGLGIKFVVVPGTHVRIDQLLAEKGIKGKYVGTYQTSDSKLLEAAMEVAGRISLAIETKLSPGPPILSLRRHGDNDRWHELGVCVTSGNFLVAKKRVVDGHDFGSTGEVKRIDVLRIREWLNKECLVILSNLGCSSAGEVLNCNTYEVAAACALAIKADKLICITDGKILDEQDRPLRFMTLDDADMLIRKRSKQSAVTENYVLVGGEELICSPGYIDSHQENNLSWNEKAYNRRCNATFHNGVGFDNGNGLWSGKQGFAIWGEQPGRLSGYLSELAAAAYVCRGGVQRAHIIDGTLGGSLLLELFTRDGVGTMVASDVYEGTRSAIAADLPGIKRVIQPLEVSGVLIKRTDEELLKQLDSFIVVERDGSVIACAALIPFPDDNCGEVAAIAASPECRGQGQGSKMLDFIEKKALLLGLKRLFLLTTRAADWFVRRGFTECPVDSIPAERRKRIDLSLGSKYYTKELQMEEGGITISKFALGNR